ncbi:Hypothetical predicted protein, partial [Pelobates cultripes]
ADTADQLDEPISMGELALAIKSMKPGRSPGPDGLPLKYYKSYAETLYPPLLAMFNAIREGHELPTQALMTHITIIPKEGKDREHCGSFRPISLINNDIKLLAKVLATRLQEHVPSLVHADQ